MKRVFLLLTILVSALSSFALETKKIAILEVVDKNNELSYYQKLMLRTRLAEEVNKAVGFEAYDRTNMDAIMGEHNFQRTGFVSQDQIRRLGEMAGAAYILVIEGALSGQGSLFVSAVVLDVETGKMVLTESINMPSSEEGLIQGCAILAKKVFGKLSAASNAYVQEAKRIQQEKEEAEEAERAKYYIYKHKNTYTYMGSKMDKKAYVNFLKNNCPEAYKQYNKGTKTIIGGWCVFGLGLACVAGGGIEYFMAGKNYKDVEKRQYWELYTDDQKESLRKKRDQYYTIGYAIMGVGGAITITSIPILAVGYSKQKKSVQTYNRNCSSPKISPLTLNLTAGPNGLGVAMNF